MENPEIYFEEENNFGEEIELNISKVDYTIHTPSTGIAHKEAVEEPNIRNLQICEDEPGFIDSWGLDCSVWVNVDCKMAEMYGYQPHDAERLRYSCRKTCGTCDVHHAKFDFGCEDTVGFIDAFGLRCEDWLKTGCNWKMGYHKKSDLMDLRRNCPKSCGLCLENYKGGFNLQPQKTVKVYPQFHNLCITISHKYKFIYVQYPKTAGSNTIRILKQELCHKFTFGEPYCKTEECSCDDLDVLDHGQPDNFCVQLEDFPDQQTWEDYFVFTMVREPIERAVSAFNYCEVDIDPSVWCAHSSAIALPCGKCSAQHCAPFMDTLIIGDNKIIVDY
eukprot:UN34277